MNQCECHPYCTQEDLRKFCDENKIVFQAYRPLCGGQILQDPTVKDIASKYDKTPAQICIRWSLQHNMATIPKSTVKKRIEENSQVFGWELSEEDMKALDGLNRDYHSLPDPNKLP